MDALDGIRASLEKATLGVGTGPIALAFSGGLDSAILGYILRDSNNITIYTVGMDGSRDFQAARSAVEAMGIREDRWRKVKITDDMVHEALNIVPRVIGSAHPMLVCVSIPFYVLCKVATEQVMISGQGADELFGGYKRYERMDPKEGEKAMRSNALDLLKDENKREEGIAALFEKRVIKPFLFPEVMETALALPYSSRIGGGQRKIILRELAERMGLPRDIAWQEKKAMQFSTGVSKAVRRMASEAGLDERGFLEGFL